MGSQNTNYSKNTKIKEELNRNQFEFLYVVGKGGFGKVWKVCHKKTKRFFALKEMSKAKIIDKKSEKSIKYEKELLCRLKHPFIVNMQYAFQDYENLYLVMDLLNGGDLRYHISRHKKFSEEQTRFFVACLLLGLEYIHNNNVLHRDIKPENLVLDERGYLRITDFGIAKVYQKENSSETSGTPGYMSPEVMCAQNHTFAVDFFAVGVLAYEFMHGRRPYVGKSRKEIKEQIIAKQVQIKPDEIPEGWSEDAADIINKLLQRKPGNRLGTRSTLEVKEHPWLKYYPWKELYEKKLEAPFIPKHGDNFDKRYCESADKIGDETRERYEKYSQDENFQIIFKNFTVLNFLNFDQEVNISNSQTLRKKELRESGGFINKNSLLLNENLKSNSKHDINSPLKNNNINNSNSKIRPMHMRSSSVSIPSSNLINPGIYNNNQPYVNNSNFYSGNLNNAFNNSSTGNLSGLTNFNSNTGQNVSNKINNNSNNNHNNKSNSNLLKSKVKIIEKTMRSNSSIANPMANATNFLKNSYGNMYKQKPSFNNVYGSSVQMNNSNSNFNVLGSNSKFTDKSPEKRSTPLLNDVSKSLKIPLGKLPNINNLDKLKIRKLVNSSTSNLLLKYYKQNPINSNNSTAGTSFTNLNFAKKNLGPPTNYVNINN